MKAPAVRSDARNPNRATPGTAPRIVTLRELVHAGCEAGLHVSSGIVLVAIRNGELTAHTRNPLTFTVDDANAWLSKIAREP